MRKKVFAVLLGVLLLMGAFVIPIAADSGTVAGSCCVVSDVDNADAEVDFAPLQHPFPCRGPGAGPACTCLACVCMRYPFGCGCFG